MGASARWDFPNPPLLLVAGGVGASRARSGGRCISFVLAFPVAPPKEHLLKKTADQRAGAAVVLPSYDPGHRAIDSLVSPEFVSRNQLGRGRGCGKVLGTRLASTLLMGSFGIIFFNSYQLTGTFP